MKSTSPVSWKKQGLIYNVDGSPEWMNSHAQVPSVLVKNDYLRIYFSSRTKHIKSLPTFIDVKKDDPASVINVHTEPLLELGELGTFDDDGIMPCSVVESDGDVYLYYVGWNRGVTVSYRNSIGLAISKDGGNTFERLMNAPVVDRLKNEPHMAASPFVMKEGDIWHLWYTSGTHWISVDKKYEPVYTIRYASSSDGINWQRTGKTCIIPSHDKEAFARPSVIKTDGIYCMWYNYRESEDYRDGAGSYRMGYAESGDAIEWVRKDSEVGISRSDVGWDSKMMCYAHTLVVNGKLHMFYNGNGFGTTGIGYAISEL